MEKFRVASGPDRAAHPAPGSEDSSGDRRVLAFEIRRLIYRNTARRGK
jgi:hypothetical protein